MHDEILQNLEVEEWRVTMGWLIILVWLACAFFTAGIAERKNMSRARWFITGLIFGPLALGLVSLSSAYPASEEMMRSRGLQKCPHCAEEIKLKALVCKHCGRDIPTDETPS